MFLDLRLASKVKQLEQFSYVEQFKIYEGEKNVFIMVHFHDISTLVLSSAVLKIHRYFTFFLHLNCAILMAARAPRTHR